MTKVQLGLPDPRERWLEGIRHYLTKNFPPAHGAMSRNVVAFQHELGGNGSYCLQLFSDERVMVTRQREPEKWGSLAYYGQPQFIQLDEVDDMHLHQLANLIEPLSLDYSSSTPPPAQVFVSNNDLPIPILGMSENERAETLEVVQHYLRRVTAASSAHLLLAFQEPKNNGFECYHFLLYATGEVIVMDMDYGVYPGHPQRSIQRQLEQLENYFLEILARQVKCYL